jgi:dTDP-4-amino-4,6-dideoxygalactose transaminase
MRSIKPAKNNPCKKVFEGDILLRVPLLDLQAQYEGIEHKVLQAIKRVYEHKKFILGPEVKKLEAEIAAYSNTEYAIGVASGSDAILLPLMALGIGPGDEVITTPYTFFATAGSISRLGAKIVFADIDDRTYNILPERIESNITSKTKAILPVHLYGQCADMDPILEIGKRHNIPVIEDAAQAIGAEYVKDGVHKRAGSMGVCGCFSFFPSKNLGCMGDGGMIVTSQPDLAEKVSLLRVHGSHPKYYHQMVGLNSRLDTLQAAVLSVKLKYLDDWTTKRQQNAALYNKLFKANELLDVVTLPFTEFQNRHIYNQFVIRTRKRNQLREFLQKKEIGTEIYYPVPLHFQECYRQLGYQEGDFPNAEKAANETLALPIYSELTREMQEAVVAAIKEFFRG